MEFKVVMHKWEWLSGLCFIPFFSLQGPRGPPGMQVICLCVSTNICESHTVVSEVFGHSSHNCHKYCFNIKNQQNIYFEERYYVLKAERLTFQNVNWLKKIRKNLFGSCQTLVEHKGNWLPLIFDTIFDYKINSSCFLIKGTDGVNGMPGPQGPLGPKVRFSPPPTFILCLYTQRQPSFHAGTVFAYRGIRVLQVLRGKKGLMDPLAWRWAVCLWDSWQFTG